MWDCPDEQLIADSGEIFKTVLRHSKDSRVHKIVKDMSRYKPEQKEHQERINEENEQKNALIENRNKVRSEAIDGILEEFWKLTGNEKLRKEVYGVLAQTTQIEQTHMKFICDQIKEGLPKEVDKLQFDLLQQNVRFHGVELRPLVRDIFWKVISNSELYKDKDGLIEHCIIKFIKYNRNQWVMEDVE